MKELLCAVDPGKAGGIAWIEPGKGVQAVGMPDTDGRLLERIRWLVAASHGSNDIFTPRDFSKGTRVFIEQVGGYVRPAELDEEGELKGGHPGSAMFTFGENAGLVRGMFLALGAKVEMIRPQEWQKILFLKKGKRSKPEWKRILKQTAQRHFPGVRVTLKTADALLLLRYGFLKSGHNVPATGEKGSGGHPGAIPGDFSEGTESAGEKERVPRGTTPKGSRFVWDWKGKPWVFEKGASGSHSLVRPASLEDQKSLPRIQPSKA